MEIEAIHLVKKVGKYCCSKYLTLDHNGNKWWRVKGDLRFRSINVLLKSYDGKLASSVMVNVITVTSLKKL